VSGARLFYDDVYNQWTLCYSHGNYGPDYACGGTWSGHSDVLHSSICSYGALTAEETQHNIKKNNILNMINSSPRCLWYPTAAEAMQKRLPIKQIAESTLPAAARYHLIATEPDILGSVMEVINTYKL
jgi:hypothetical protein